MKNTQGNYVYDEEINAGYLYLIDTSKTKYLVANSLEVSPGIIIDFDKHGKPIGIEVTYSELH